MLGGLLTVLLLMSRMDRCLEPDAWPATVLPAAGAPALAQWLQDHLRGLSGWGGSRPTTLAPLYLGGVDTLVWGFLVSLVLGIW